MISKSGKRRFLKAICRSLITTFLYEPSYEKGRLVTKPTNLARTLIVAIDSGRAWNVKFSYKKFDKIHSFDNK